MNTFLVLIKGHTDRFQRRKILANCILRAGLIFSSLFVGNLNPVLAEPGWDVVFSNGFEESNLTPSGGSLWNKLRKQNSGLPGQQAATVTQVTDIVHSGNKSLRCFSDGGDSANTAKADIYKTNLDLRIGETYRMSAWLWLPSNTYLKTITVMDVECTAGSGQHDCNVAKTVGPRIWIVDRKESGPPKFMFGRGKMNLPGIDGSLPIPVGEWFKLTLEMTLGSGNDGHSRLWINDDLDIDFFGTNIQPSGMPQNDHYNFFQVGLTVNASGTSPGPYTPIALYVDDVLIEKQTENPQEEDLPPASPVGLKFHSN